MREIQNLDFDEENEEYEKAKQPETQPVVEKKEEIDYNKFEF